MRARWAGVVSLLVLAFTFTLVLGAYWWVGRLAQQDRDMIRSLDGLQLRVLALARHALLAGRGDAGAFGALPQARDELATGLTRLRNEWSVVTKSSLVSISGDVLARVQDAWAETALAMDGLLLQEGSATSLLATVVEFEAFAEDTLLRSDELVNVMVETGASPEQVYAATRQLMLLERLAHNLRRTLSRDPGAAMAAERFDRDVVHFRQVTQGLLAGDEKLGIEAVADSEARTMLEGLLAAVTGEEARAGEVLSAAASLTQIRQAAARVGRVAEILSEALSALGEAYLVGAGERLVSFRLAHVLAGFAGVLTILVLGFELRLRSRGRDMGLDEQTLAQFQEREEKLKDSQRRNQEALLRLLAEANAVAAGDLSVEATASEDLAGALAQALNATVEKVRELVAIAGETAERAEDVVATAAGSESLLSQVDEDQVQRLHRAAALLDSSITVLAKVATVTTSLDALAERSIEATEHGGAMAAKVAEALDAVRAGVHQELESLRRLAERCQPAGELAAFLLDIADKTNILALNTAIRASGTADATRSLTGVADELQRFSEKLTQVGRRSHSLVRSIEVGIRHASGTVENMTAAVGASARVARETQDATVKTGENLGKVRFMLKDLLESTKKHPEPVEMIRNATVGLRELSGPILESSRELGAQLATLDETTRVLRQVLTRFESGREDVRTAFEAAQAIPDTYPADRQQPHGVLDSEATAEEDPPATLGLQEQARVG